MGANFGNFLKVIVVALIAELGWLQKFEVSEIRHPDGELEIFVHKNRIWSLEMGLSGDPNGPRIVRATNGRVMVKNIYQGNQLSDCDIVKSKEEIQDFLREFQSRVPSHHTNHSRTSDTIHFHKLRTDCVVFHESLDLERGDKEKDKRVKRSLLIFPGTNWCGKGNQAKYVSDFGSATKTDKCCLEHDGCPYIIEGLARNFNYFNYRLHTLSYCDCDKRYVHSFTPKNNNFSI